MKNRKLFFYLLLSFCIVGSNKAQTQSMLLPISGSSTPTGPTKVINFTNPATPVTTSLPSHSFTVNGVQPGQENPHNEQHLEFAIPSINEKYLGQHPMFAQTVVHDKDGNILFSIIDYNIYNRYGEYFSLANDFQLDHYLTRFINPASAYTSLDPEIVVFPIYKEEEGGAPACYKYGIIYSFFTRTNSISFSICYRTLQYVNDQEIVLSDPISLNQTFQDAIVNFVGFSPGGWCDDESHRNLAIVEIGNNEHMLFIRLWHFLCAVKIFDNGMIADNIHVENILQGMYVQEQKNQPASEMEAVFYNNYFYVGLGSCYKNPDNPVSGSYAHVCILKFDNNLSLESGYPINHWMPQGNSSPERIKGLEFSPNCDRLFVTYSGQNNLYAINTSGAISNTIMNNPDFTADLY